MMANPKLFISYSWSNSPHEKWVLNLATELRESGIDVILDKWDLREGNDAVAFMEKMVTDSEIKKVVMVTDEIYASKADGRDGGVGTETQIISKEVYDNQEQDKFVAVVAQKDDEGKPYLPTYYKSRIYIDLSEEDNYADNFETLLRWIYDKPLYIKPKIGKRPSFLDESERISLGTTAAYKRAIVAIKKSKPYATGALDEYLSIFSKNLEKFRLANVEGEFDDAMVEIIEKFIPYRNEAIQLFFVIAHYNPNEERVSKLHRFFESLIPYMERTEDITSYKGWDFDNFKFIVHELFLYAIAIFIKSERFGLANIFLSQNYYVAGNSGYGLNVMVAFNVFRKDLKSLDHRNDRLKLRRLSLRADMLEQRAKGSGLEFRYLMQADFILFLRAEIENEGGFSSWWPETLLYLFHFNSSFEIFARAISKNYFDKIKCLLSIDKKEGLNNLLESYKNGKRRLPRWEGTRIYPSELIGFEHLATKP